MMDAYVNQSAGGYDLRRVCRVGVLRSGMLGRTAIIGAAGLGEYALVRQPEYHSNQNTPTTTSRRIQHTLQAAQSSPIRRVHRRPTPRRREYQLDDTAEYS